MLQIFIDHISLLICQVLNKNKPIVLGQSLHIVLSCLLACLQHDTLQHGVSVTSKPSVRFYAKPAKSWAVFNVCCSCRYQKAQFLLVSLVLSLPLFLAKKNKELLHKQILCFVALLVVIHYYYNGALLSGAEVWERSITLFYD